MCLHALEEGYAPICTHGKHTAVSICRYNLAESHSALQNADGYCFAPNGKPSTAHLSYILGHVRTISCCLKQSFIIKSLKDNNTLAVAGYLGKKDL